jgi:protein-histidine N-methyltransferase
MGGDLDVTPELIAVFSSAINTMAMNLTFISGSWAPAPAFLSLIPTSSQMNTLVLASETIYSSMALQTFTTALVGILNGVRIGKAMIAAKRVYFGVGGSVDAFKVECASQGAVASEIDNHGVDLGLDNGVRRCLLEVQML